MPDCQRCVRADGVPNWGHGLDHRHHVALARCYQVASTHRGHSAEPNDRDTYRRPRGATLETTLRKTLELDPPEIAVNVAELRIRFAH
jgi:hypothetical protein